MNWQRIKRLFVSCGCNKKTKIFYEKYMNFKDKDLSIETPPINPGVYYLTNRKGEMK